MREIKFRAKRKDNGEWVYGSLDIGNDNWTVRPLLGSRFIVDPKTVGQFTGLCDKEGKEIFEGDVLSEIIHPQIYDKQGEDYEIHSGITCHYEAIYRDIDAGFSLKRIHVSEQGIKVGSGFYRSEIAVGDFYPLSSQNGYEPKNKMRIIGNIYDNPKLINNSNADQPQP